MKLLSRMFVMAAMIASFDMMIYAITRPIMVGMMDSSVNQKIVLMVKMYSLKKLRSKSSETEM